jgi:hypothetical protein
MSQLLATHVAHRRFRPAFRGPAKALYFGWFYHIHEFSGESFRCEKNRQVAANMEKQEAKSKWDELVRQLGAEVSPEAEQLVETGPAPPSEIPSSPFRQSSETSVEQLPPAPKRPAAGWDNLASEFGLPAPEEPAELVVEQATAAAVSKPVVASRIADEDRAKRERPGPERRDTREKPRESSEKRREPAHRRREQSDKRDEPSGQRRESRRFRDTREGGEEVAEAHSTERHAPPTTRYERQDRKPERIYESAKPEPAKAEPAKPEPAKPGPAVSLWHKIFGSPADQSAKLEEISTDSTDEAAAADAGAEQSTIGDMDLDRDRAGDEFVESDRYDDIEHGTERGTDSEQLEQGETRPRRPRRRRRGRGGRGEEPADAGDRAGRRPRRLRESEEQVEDRTPPADDDDDSDLDLPTDDDDSMEDNGDGAETGATRSARSRASLQRSIPSWDEAIGYIVDVNMQARSQRRPSGHTGSRTNSSRGRPRGRRKN